MADIEKFFKKYRDSDNFQKSIKGGMFRTFTSVRAEIRRRLRAEGATAKALKNEFGMLQMKQESWQEMVLTVKNFDLSGEFFESKAMRDGGVKIKGRLSRAIKWKNAFLIKGIPFYRSLTTRKLEVMDVPGENEVGETSQTIEQFGKDYFELAKKRARSSIYGSLRGGMKKALSEYYS